MKLSSVWPLVSLNFSGHLDSGWQSDREDLMWVSSHTQPVSLHLPQIRSYLQHRPLTVFEGAHNNTLDSLKKNPQSIDFPVVKWVIFVAHFLALLCRMRVTVVTSWVSSQCLASPQPVAQRQWLFPSQTVHTNFTASSGSRLLQTQTWHSHWPECRTERGRPHRYNSPLTPALLYCQPALESLIKLLHCSVCVRPTGQQGFVSVLRRGESRRGRQAQGYRGSETEGQAGDTADADRWVTAGRPPGAQGWFHIVIYHSNDKQWICSLSYADLISSGQVQLNLSGFILPSGNSQWSCFANPL